MPPDRTHGLNALQRGFASAAPPKEITQSTFEGDPQHLRRLVQLRPGDRAEARDLWEYTQDPHYTDIQSSLLAHLMPFCLEAWQEDLRGTDGGAAVSLSTSTPFWRTGTFSTHI